MTQEQENYLLKKIENIINNELDFDPEIGEFINKHKAAQKILNFLQDSGVNFTELNEKKGCQLKIQLSEN